MGDHQMASSDDEDEVLPDCVTNYHFVDDKDQPISFSILPHKWSEDEIPDGSNMQIFLRGTAESGQTIYQSVIAWKSELSYVLPEIYVLSKKKTWIKLRRPRRSFEDTFKTILITVHCLHFLKRNPEANGSDLWAHLRKAFRSAYLYSYMIYCVYLFYATYILTGLLCSSYEVDPSESHLLCHMHLIKEAAMRDKDIAKSEVCDDGNSPSLIHLNCIRF